jgi:hypothetical protein
MPLLACLVKPRERAGPASLRARGLTVVLSLPITSDFGTRLAQHRKAHGLS